MWGSKPVVYNKNILERSVLAKQKHGSDDKSFQGELWKQINLQVNFADPSNTNTKWVSLGSTENRENLFFDQDSPFVRKLTDSIISESKQIKKRYPDNYILEILKHINLKINELTTIEGYSDKESEDFLDDNLEKFLKTKNSLDISFDELVQASPPCLVCRHKGLLAASLIGSLVKAKVLPQGEARQYRSSLEDRHGNIIGAHTWAIYRNDTTKVLWMCDPRWRTVDMVKTSFHANNPEVKRYGENVINLMLKRANKKDGKQEATPILVKNSKSVSELCTNIFAYLPKIYSTDGEQISKKELIENIKSCFKLCNENTDPKELSYNLKYNLVPSKYGLRKKAVELILKEKFEQAVQNADSLERLLSILKHHKGKLFDSSQIQINADIDRFITQFKDALSFIKKNKTLNIEEIDGILAEIGITSNYHLRSKTKELLSLEMKEKKRPRVGNVH